MNENELVTGDASFPLRKYTNARIGLGRSGGSLPTREWLAFRAAHAAARDAVHLPFDDQTLRANIESAIRHDVVIVSSAAPDRAGYLLRPDLGRRLDEESAQRLKERGEKFGPNDLCIIVSDGLSTAAVHQNAVPVLEALWKRLKPTNWRVAPICIARLGRVALQDQVGSLLQSGMVVTLIGERPGLATANSLGAYLVHGPKAQNTDAERNCVSNIHEQGLSAEAGADAIYQLILQMTRFKLSGVALGIARQRSLLEVDARAKDESS